MNETKIVARFEYKDKEGKVLYIKERIEPGRDGRKKEFVFKYPKNGQWVLGRGCDPVPFNLPAVIKSAYSILVEGEGKAEELGRLGLVASSLCAGSSSPWREEYNEYFKGKEKIVVLPDQDEAGRHYAQTVVEGLKGVVSNIKIVELSGLNKKEDVINWIQKRNHKTKKEIKNELLEEIRKAPIFQPAKEATSSPITKPSKTWPKTQEDCFYGLCGDFIRTIEPHSEADPAALLIQFIIAFGNVIGKNPFIRTEADEQHTNLFAVLVGQTSRGRKGTSWGYVNRLFKEVDSKWAKDCIRSGLSSGEGLIHQVRDSLVKYDEGKETTVDAGVNDKRLLVKEGEFVSVLRMIKREGNTLSPVIRECFDSGNLAILTKKDPHTASDVHISIIGHITREELIRELTATDAANGFGNRYLWVCTKRSKLLPEGGNLNELDFEVIISRVREAVAFAKIVGELKKDDSARDLWIEIYPDLTEDRMGLLGALTSRAEPITLRLASLYALLDLSATIKLKHLQAALALWDYCDSSAAYIFGASLGDEVADQIHKALKAAPNGLNRTQISELFSNHKDKSQINRALGVLNEKGLARCEQIQTGGRSAEVWLTGKAKKAN